MSRAYRQLERFLGIDDSARIRRRLTGRGAYPRHLDSTDCQGMIPIAYIIYVTGPDGRVNDMKIVPVA